MKFILFYTCHEYKRKPWQCLAAILLCGILVFCMTSLTILLASNAAAHDIANLENPDYQSEIHFFSANFLLLLGIHALLLLTGMGLLTNGKLHHHSREYGILHDLGVGKKQLLLLQININALALIISSTVSVPLALLFMHNFIERINLRVQQTVLVFQVPVTALFLSCLLLLLAVLIGTAIPCLKQKRVYDFKPEGVFDDRYPVAKMFRVTMRRRCRKQRHADLLIYATVQILPLIFLIAAMSFHTLPEAAYDCSISINQETKYPITEAVLLEIESLDGIQKVDTRTDTLRGTGFYTNIKVKFERDYRENGLQKMQRMPILQQYDLTDLFHTTQTASLINIAYRELFLQIAGIMLPVSLVLLFFLFISSGKSKNQNMNILYALGMNNKEIQNTYRIDALQQGAYSSLIAIFVAAGLYTVMEVEGGGSPPFLEILIIGTGYFLVSLILSNVTAEISYQRFLRNLLR